LKEKASSWSVMIALTLRSKKRIASVGDEEGAGKTIVKWSEEPLKAVNSKPKDESEQKYTRGGGKGDIEGRADQRR
jgi:hypothetical protein